MAMPGRGIVVSNRRIFFASSGYVEKFVSAESRIFSSPPIPDVVARVLTLFASADTVTVAKQAWFTSHREMVAHMATINVCAYDIANTFKRHHHSPMPLS